MTFKVQWLNQSRMWVTMMSGCMSEQDAIRYAEHRAKQLAEKIRVICGRGSVVYMCN
tara:strand:+ start:771 stop:941 length:171 start_codon:yes stop_codon:yes gene_type:complete